MLAVLDMIPCILFLIFFIDPFSFPINLTALNCSQLPLPYLKAGYLTAPPAGIPVAPHSDWKRSQFVLNHEGLQQVDFVCSLFCT